LTLDLMAKHSLDFWLTSEDLPDPDNRVTLDRDGRIVLSYTPNNEEGHKRLIARLEALMQQQTCDGARGELPRLALRAEPLRRQRIPLAGVAHQNGTLRFGTRSGHLGTRHDCKATRSTTCTSWTAASSRRAARSTRR
jgi:hypothetical protein